MKKTFFVAGYLFLFASSLAQTISQKLEKAFQQFESDGQLKHAISSFYVIDAKTGKVIFDKNSQIGLAPASTQKIITSVTAFELLGKNYRYETRFTLFGRDIGVSGAGDPTFGSWRFSSTKDTVLFDEIITGIRKSGLEKVRNVFTWNNELSKKIPSGWIYEDIGNYYGATPFNISWRENQYNIVFIPGKKAGDRTSIDTASTFFSEYIVNECTTGPPGSGDNAFIYFVPGERRVLVQGTIPAGVARFTISGAHKMPACWFGLSFAEYAKSKGFVTEDSAEYFCSEKNLNKKYRDAGPGWYFDSSSISKPQYIHYSPSLDSIIYWLNKKSVNLYAEALLQTFAYQKNGVGSTEEGVSIVKNFWRQKGLDEDELNISDGSGLSPQNRVTTHAQVEILKYAKTRSWFPYFYQSLPEFNDMTMKSGTIKDVKGFCGYHKAKDGKEYIFSFLVNNYNGPSSGLVNKMYRVLNVLK